MYNIDLCRKSIFSQSGKNAGNQSTSEYLRNELSNYDKNLSRLLAEKRKQKENPAPKNQDYGLYL